MPARIDSHERGKNFSDVDRSALLAALAVILPPAALLADREDLKPCECDGLTAYRQMPLAVALPARPTNCLGTNLMGHVVASTSSNRSWRVRSRRRRLACIWTVARENARRNIDAWWSQVVNVESVVVAAERDDLDALLQKPALAERRKLAFHSPRTLQHGLKIRGSVEQLLTAAGFDLTLVAHSHPCCGSAGTYSILQPDISRQLRDNKLIALSTCQPVGIASANIGCILHLQSGTRLPLKHWIEWLDECLSV